MKVGRESRLRKGSSDPISFQCTCSSSTEPTDGKVLLFFRYFKNAPRCLQPLQPTSELVTFHTNLTTILKLGGKIRVAEEGFNVTVAGTKDGIEQYIEECCSHWSFDGLDLNTTVKRDAFFKPTNGGCACVFGGLPASVRLTAEITPMGRTSYSPRDWDVVEGLEPAEFHERCWKHEKKVIVDVRNHYESRIGYFVDPVSGRKAITPEIRRFSQWPQYVSSHKDEFEADHAIPGQNINIMAYCTGGIRCEKATRWMADELNVKEGDRICTLNGGIAAYMTWMDEEIRQGRKQASESLFRGKNYVFDARGSVGLSTADETDSVARCHVCHTASDRMSKCRSEGCHLILVVCSECEKSSDPRCCSSCLELDEKSLPMEEDAVRVQRPICDCEKQREARLWGDLIRPAKTQGWRKKKRQAEPVNVHIKLIDQN
ncbi:hypothetical protein BJ878DRAFT_519808 [Calycina marina]|uniref:Rhodanese domain-containing protein n=1 Tax=Calycina marina TaxID=1763456 RepID=A0A9P7YXM7_9HELO|nr:hypothetical protein BJ878DRAFT_519808 [Calycina marina]